MRKEVVPVALLRDAIHKLTARATMYEQAEKVLLAVADGQPGLDAAIGHLASAAALVLNGSTEMHSHEADGISVNADALSITIVAPHGTGQRRYILTNNIVENEMVLLGLLAGN